MRNTPKRLAVASVLLCALMLTVFVAGGTPSLDTATGKLSVSTGSIFTFSDEPESQTSFGSFEPSTVYKYEDMKATIASHAAVNADVKAWLTVPNTNIDYPIVLSTQDNKYYEYRDWRGNYYPNTNYLNYTTTAIYLDYRTRVGTTWQSSSKNFVLYGHNWTNLRNPLYIGNNSRYVMFEQLPSYTNQQFAQQNPHIYFSTGDNEGVWRVFAVAYCELSADFFYNNPDPTTAQYQTILNEWKARSMYNFDVDVNTDDRILTLTTCTRVYNVGSYQRYTVIARLLRPGESENDAVTVTVNPNPKAPDFSKIGQTTATGALIAAETSAETTATADEAATTNDNPMS